MLFFSAGTIGYIHGTASEIKRYFPLYFLKECKRISDTLQGFTEIKIINFNVGHCSKCYSIIYAFTCYSDCAKYTILFFIFIAPFIVV
jgi:hypothetical protein